MENLLIKNVSSANSKSLKEFYYELDNLHPKFIDLINKRGLKIVFADKMSDVINEKTLSELREYSENYNFENIDNTIRGICSDTIENGAICIFYNTAKDVIGAILYHEIGHLVDYYKDFNTPNFSISNDFIDAYKKDLKENWEKIEQDKRYRLIHYIQKSTPENPDKIALMETFAHCFARSFDKIDDIDIVSEYFNNSLKVTKAIVEKFLAV